VPGHDVHRREHVGLGVVTLCPQARDHLFLVTPAGKLGADDAGEDQVGGPAQHLRADDRERDADDAERQQRTTASALRPEHAQQPQAGA